MRSSFDFAPFHRSTVGFDRLFSMLDQVSGGDDSVSFALTTNSSKSLDLASRETGLHAPRLVVERGGNDNGDQPTTTTNEP